ncbi:hypothetical protein SAMN02745664_1234 [Moraxella cuniculi DSM 21768]|uniref:Haemolysin XhlA n=1 Tax=Moraxella cuniculi DSM 21768 TaxID=1122245 RepID=A0A1N7G3U6_9GAMM|nr:hypothetical protein [Moraxella cuniculi]OOS03280.1 hypothetical protein B0189_09770 [Moraxella cuniculi]SIS07247.1 hypothetical protein SAMN02745664_1234 [Moraxella cuniculi DSM 21768]
MVDINRIDLGKLDKENLEKVKLMLDINKIQADIEMTRQSVEQSRATVEKMRKENQWFPWLQIITTLTTGILTGGVVVFVLTKLLQ